MIIFQRRTRMAARADIINLFDDRNDNIDGPSRTVKLSTGFNF